MTYTRFEDFYYFYLSEHTDKRNRLLHFLGGWVVLAVLVLSCVYGFGYLIWAPIGGYFPAWLGHFVFEQNKPATFKQPFYSLIAYWVMFWQIMTRRLPL